MREHVSIDSIDKFIRENAWFDFCVSSFSGVDLKIHGGIDLTVSRQLEITFVGVLCYFGTFDWKSDTANTVFDVPAGDELRALNLKYEIEVGYSIFRFTPEYHTNPVIIAAEGISVDFSEVPYG